MTHPPTSFAWTDPMPTRLVVPAQPQDVVLDSGQHLWSQGILAIPTGAHSQALTAIDALSEIVEGRMVAGYAGLGAWVTRWPHPTMGHVGIGVWPDQSALVWRAHTEDHVAIYPAVLSLLSTVTLPGQTHSLQLITNTTKGPIVGRDPGQGHVVLFDPAQRAAATDSHPYVAPMWDMLTKGATTLAAAIDDQPPLQAYDTPLQPGRFMPSFLLAGDDGRQQISTEALLDLLSPLLARRLIAARDTLPVRISCRWGYADAAGVWRPPYLRLDVDTPPSSIAQKGWNGIARPLHWVAIEDELQQAFVAAWCQGRLGPPQAWMHRERHDRVAQTFVYIPKGISAHRLLALCAMPLDAHGLPVTPMDAVS